MINNRDRVKTAFERNTKVLKLKPSWGRGTAVTTIRVQSGFRCEIEEGDWTLTADMSEKHGGYGAGPNPGVFGRAALGSCLAMCYVRWAALLDVPLNGLDVEIQADYDARGEYGFENVAPDYSEIRYVVTVDSQAPEEDIMRFLDKAETHTPFLAVFRQPQTIRREVRILTSTE